MNESFLPWFSSWNESRRVGRYRIKTPAPTLSARGLSYR